MPIEIVKVEPVLTYELDSPNKRCPYCKKNINELQTDMNRKGDNCHAITVTTCGHYYHNNCYVSYTSRNGSCIECNAIIESKNTFFVSTFKFNNKSK